MLKSLVVSCYIFPHKSSSTTWKKSLRILAFSPSHPEKRMIVVSTSVIAHGRRFRGRCLQVRQNGRIAWRERKGICKRHQTAWLQVCSPAGWHVKPLNSVAVLNVCDQHSEQLFWTGPPNQTSGNEGCKYQWLSNFKLNMCPTNTQGKNMTKTRFSISCSTSRTIRPTRFVHISCWTTVCLPDPFLKHVFWTTK